MEVFDYFVNLNQPESDTRYSQAIGKENVIFLVNSTKDAFAPHSGCISFKSTFNGQEYFEFDRRRLAVSPQNYLLMNDGQEYGSFIDSESSVESFTVFFATDFVTKTLAALSQNDNYLLDNPEDSLATHSSLFFEKLYPINQAIYKVIQSIKYHIQANQEKDTFLLEEHLYTLLLALLKEQKIVQDTINNLPSVRASTRQEMYKRVCKARDYMYSCYGENINVDTLARVACLAPFHFLRAFKQVFQITPHQMLTRIRLEQAQNQLLHTQNSVAQVGINIGFDNLSSFTRLFTTAYGQSPRRFRQTHQPMAK
ncbi:hypothetical protein BKI52_37770 [marine bacterium AO1-C]|nr:hypothetical protein BKI52_37770 [marine bacterium AO1-C]